MDSSSDEELLVRPNSGRDVVPRSGELVAHTPPGSSEFRTSGTLRSRREVLTCVDSETTAQHGQVQPGMAVDDVPSAIVDALEMDLSPVSLTVPASVGAVRRIGRATPHLRRVVLMPQSAGTPRSVQDAIDEEGEGALTSFEGEVASQHRRRLGGGEGPRVDDVPGPEVFAMSGSDTESNGEAEGSDAEGQDVCGTNRSSQSFEHGAEGESSVESVHEFGCGVPHGCV